MSSAKEKIRQKFLEHIRLMISYWKQQNLSEDEKMSGVAFSILTALDGCSSNMPHCLVIPLTAENEKVICDIETRMGEGIVQNMSISGALHDKLGM